MGAFVGCYGETKIPDEKCEEFTERVLKVFDQGGMMYRDRIHIFDKELTLLMPYHTAENGVIRIDFNYFEDDSWETAGYDPATARIFTNKVGCNEFNAVMRAVYVLGEIYSEESCIAEVDGEPIDTSLHVRWLNYLFGGRVNNQCDPNLWRVYQLFPEDKRNSDFMELLNDGGKKSLRITTAIKYIFCTDEASVAEILEETDWDRSPAIMEWVRVLFKSLQKLYTSSGESAQETLEHIIKHLIREEPLREFWEFSNSEEEWRVVLTAAFLPKEVTVKCISEVFGLDYESAMEWGGKICDHSEIWDKDAEPLEPLPPVDTATFLDEAHYISFFESIGEEFHHLTDDDRIWWWREDGDVHLSEEAENWLQGLREEWQSILATEARKSVADVQKLWVDTLADADEDYHNMYCFRDCFYEFLTQTEKPEVQAAILLLKRLVDRNRQEMIYQTGEDFMDLIMSLGADVRKEIKRYLALLDNRGLRQKVFGF